MNGHKLGDSVDFIDSQKGLLEDEEGYRDMERQISEVEMSGAGFGFILVFPLPSHSSSEEDEPWFKSQFINEKTTFRDMLVSCLVAPSMKKRAETIQCDESLKSLRAATVELLQNFFSLVGGQADVEIFEFISVDDDELFICIKMSDDLAERLADEGEYPLQLNRSALGKLEVPILLTDTQIVPTYAKYDKFMKDKGLLTLHERLTEPGVFSILTQIDRIRLVYDMITDFIDLNQLSRLGLIAHFYPAHHKRELKMLQLVWSGKSMHTIFTTYRQPIDKIRNYYGENIALYFLLLQTMMQGLMVACPVGILATVFSWAGYQDQALCFTAPFVTIWFMVLCKVWNRKEAYYANRWGTDHVSALCSIKEAINPDFRGELKPSPCNEYVLTLQPDQMAQKCRRVVSAFVILLYIGFVVMSMCATQAWATRLDKEAIAAHQPFGFTNSYKLAAVVLSLQIQVLDRIWGFVATWLAVKEQHVNLFEFNQSIAAKSMVMKFVTAFNTFFFIAYVKPTYDKESCAPAGGCRALLWDNLMIIVPLYVGFGICNALVPYFMLKWKVWQEARALRRELMKEQGKTNPNEVEVPRLSFMEQQAKMLVFDGHIRAMDYLSLLLPLAFVALFGSFAPSIILVGPIVMWTQIKMGAWKMTMVYKRPLPIRASSIGVWNTALQGLIYLAVCNNIGLVLSQVTYFDAFAPGDKWLIFFISQNLFVAFKGLMDYLVHDMPAYVRLEQQRQEVQRQHLFESADEKLDMDKQLVCNGSEDTIAEMAQVAKLEPGHEMFVEPLL